ncbi:ABC transporter permease [Virgibacillus dokdonensis]|uniref:Transport permease protein n=1 Tax=Virgibacillus dokdonensis TaxID=302167 RepID=A0A2K9IW58_9BACI|nr:ABC transporter permease [Virgibacillus dokdonensis]AUJ23989.1 Teichoic acid translocation permease protein TagG [Virgibacillus dokdonensis]
MFKEIKQVLQEQFQYRDLIFRMASFEIKAKYQIHYLGAIWQILNPSIQIAIYWFVFGLGIRGGNPVTTKLGEVPFFLWMLMGLIPWFFISPSIVGGSNSVHQKVSLVSKMKFPISLLPTTKLFVNSFQFITMLSLLFIVLFIYGIYPTLHWIQLVYYIGCLFIFLFSFALLSSTIATLVRDYQMLLQSMMRMLLYLSPILWDPNGDRVPDWISNILKLNPFYYILTGIRSSFLGESWFFEDITYTIYFWLFTFALLYFGAKTHLKFRNNFMDYL